MLPDNNSNVTGLKTCRNIYFVYAIYGTYSILMLNPRVISIAGIKELPVEFLESGHLTLHLYL